MVMMLEQCVMNRVLYLKDATVDSVQEWNGRQVVVYHPPNDSDGNPQSVANIETLTTQAIGVILNAKIESGKLKAEAWIEIEK